MTKWKSVGNSTGCRRLLEIYRYYVEHTAITFEYETPSITEFRQRIKQTLKRYPYLAAVDGHGKIVGYAYASSFKNRAAYDWSVETTIYVDKDVKRQGIGKKLYEALEEILRKQHVINLDACITDPEIEDEYVTKNSVQYHEHLGYHMVGKFYKNAAINSDVGMIWSGWKNILENIKNIQKHLSLFLFYKEFKTFKNQEKLYNEI